ncbi:hypothetical protein D2Q93_06285 [Alicyclobacillaceae bacterium I2511]|nr:hypothetical protein D2Q93_06285 [Alicyclobacillaceae bacterium I2511]
MAGKLCQAAGKRRLIDMTTTKSPAEQAGQERDKTTTVIITQGATQLIACGMAIFPLVAGGKTPLTGHGYKDATQDLAEFQRLAAGRSCNIGIATGAVSGIWVLDIDPRHGGLKSVQGLQGKYSQLHPTWTVQTGGGGWHLYFKYDPSRPFGIGANLAGLSGIDWRGDGGYVVAPPSVTEQNYVWLKAPWTTPLADAPEWLLKLVSSKLRTAGTVPLHSTEPHSQDLLQIANGVAEGGRNNAAARLAGYLLSFRHMDPYIALALVEAWNLTNDPPLLLAELHKTFNSVAIRQAQKEGARRG